MIDRKFMIAAMAEAEKAKATGDVPIGAVVVLNGEIIGRGYNQREFLQDPTAHAEILAIRQASEFLRNWRLTDAGLYVTLEPCPMCAGAIVQARIKTLVYGAHDAKAGAVHSLMNVVQDPRLNHVVEVYDGICQQECGRQLKEFFHELRNRA